MEVTIHNFYGAPMRKRMKAKDVHWYQELPTEIFDDAFHSLCLHYVVGNHISMAQIVKVVVPFEEVKLMEEHLNVVLHLELQLV